MTDSLLDPLTGVYSRATLQYRLQDEVARAHRYQVEFALLVVDLDHFKSVNDAFGHTRGDQVLVEFVKRARQIIRTSDVVFRYGGDEFIVLLPYTPALEAKLLATRLLEVVSGTPFFGTPPLNLTLSIGVAGFPADAATPETLFERADQRVYAAKHGGRNQVVYADPALGSDALGHDREARLLERELAMASVHSFLNELRQHPRGVLTVHGARGAGHSRFLAAVGQAARLRGYWVLPIVGQAALKNRRYGAWYEALFQALPEVEPSLNVSELAHAFRTRLDKHQSVGVLVCVDGWDELDEGSQALIAQLLAEPHLALAGLVYTTAHFAPGQPLPIEAALQDEARLEPLTREGLMVWLRTLLQWDPPDPFVEWLYIQTGGLPSPAQRLLSYLMDQNVLVAKARVWTLDARYLTRSYAEAVRASEDNLYPLPATSDTFIGRAHELRDLKRALQTHAACILIAPGGMGKTRLALQAAAELRARFPAGVVFVSLAAILTEELVASALAHALGVEVIGQQSPLDRVRAHLQMLKADLLVVVDNVEHLPNISVDLTALLQASTRVRLLITSREDVALPSAARYELHGLAYPAHVDAHFAEYGAVQLFIQSAQRAAPGFTLTPADEQAVQRICQLVEGLPLGLQLAAAWVSLFSCEQLATQLESNLDTLASTNEDLPPRQRSTRAVLDYFWGLLSPSEQHQVACLAVFRGGFEVCAARDVAGASPFFLAALVHRAFLSLTSAGRYSLHELLRQYATRKLEEMTDPLAASPAAHQRHAAYYVSLAQTALPELNGPHQADWLARLEVDVSNLRVAIAWALQAGQADLALQILAALRLFWFVRGHQLEVRDKLAAILNDPQWACTPTTRAAALNTLGYLYTMLGDHQAARQTLAEALTLHRALNQPAGLAEALSHLGLAAGLAGDTATARAALEECLHIWRQLENAYEIGVTLYLLGEINWTHDPTVARRYFEESVARLRAAADKIVFAVPVRRLGQLALLSNDVPAALAHIDESLRHNEDIADQRGMLACLAALAAALQASGHIFEAVEILSAVEVILTTFNATLLPVDQLEWHKQVELTRQRCDAVTFDRAWAQGQALDLEQAIALSRTALGLSARA